MDSEQELKGIVLPGGGWMLSQYYGDRKSDGGTEPGEVHTTPVLAFVDGQAVTTMGAIYPADMGLSPGLDDRALRLLWHPDESDTEEAAPSPHNIRGVADAVEYLRTEAGFPPRSSGKVEF